jgi:predicted amidohydrolase YtcJ
MAVCRVPKTKQAMVVENGKIVYLGSNKGAMAYKKKTSDGYDSTKVVDVGGNVILPGMHDVHVHPLESGSEVGGTCELKRNGNRQT